MVGARDMDPKTALDCVGRSEIPHTNLVKIEDRGNIRWLIIDREEARNALNDGVLNALERGIAEAQGIKHLRAIVVTGAGDRAFCAGGDLKPSSNTFDFNHAEPTTSMGNLFRAAHYCDLPILARVNGHCLAGGVGLLAMCDMAVASDHGLFGLPEVKIGMFPMQVSALLQNMISPRKFAELCLTGEPLSAQEALEIGLVNYVTHPDDLDAKLDWLLSRLIDKSPTAIRLGKHALRATRDMNFEQAIAFMETQLSSISLTEDSKEGIASFNEKRSPNWTGQ
jgi:methylglutaconyl-CoA hydratase